MKYSEKLSLKLLRRASDGTTSHSTRLPKYSSQVAGYAALRGTRNPHVPLVHSGFCAPCALHPSLLANF